MHYSSVHQIIFAFSRGARLLQQFCLTFQANCYSILTFRIGARLFLPFFYFQDRCKLIATVFEPSGEV